MDDREGANTPNGRPENGSPNGRPEDGSPSDVRSDAATDGSEPPSRQHDHHGGDGHHDHHGAAGHQAWPPFPGQYPPVRPIDRGHFVTTTIDEYGSTMQFTRGAIRWDRAERNGRLMLERWPVELVPVRGFFFFHADRIYVDGTVYRFPVLTPALLRRFELRFRRNIYPATPGEQALLRDTEASARARRALDAVEWRIRPRARDVMCAEVDAWGDAELSGSVRWGFGRIDAFVWMLRALLSGSVEGRYLRLADWHACAPLSFHLRDTFDAVDQFLEVYAPEALYIQVYDY